MTLQSMTGFARTATETGTVSVSWELRSVNGRGLDVRLRTPPGYDWIDLKARQKIQKSFARGNIQANLAVERTAGDVAPVVNERFLRDVAGLAQRLQEQYDCSPASADGLLALKGVLDNPETLVSDADRGELETGILQALGDAIASLSSAREEEGQALVAVLAGKLDELDKLTEQAENDRSRTSEAIGERLAEQVALLISASPALDEQRLAQEAAILATKADIREEIDRLKAHIASAREMLSGDSPVGRKLDFLAQEFNREANTLCSKSNATSITNIGLEMKVVIDQFREQVQNLE